MSHSEEKWKHTVTESGKICKSIMNLSQSIRYVGAINKYGRTLAGFIRTGASPLLNKEKARDVFFLMSTLAHTSIDTEDSIGKLQHMLLRHEKVKLVLIPSGKVSFIITIDAEEQQYMDLVRQAKTVISN